MYVPQSKHQQSDHQQFFDYFNHIAASEMCQIWNTPNLAIKEIAEYSTGTIDKCEREGFWCELCRKYVTEFTCCRTFQYMKNCAKCAWIDDEEKEMCHDDVTNQDVMGYKCAFCPNDDDIECGEWHCEFHTDLMRSFCDVCGEDHCFNLLAGVRCDRCFSHVCERCFDAQCATKSSTFKFCDVGVHVILCDDCFDGVECKQCGNSYCGDCVQTWQETRPQIEKRCTSCNGYFCGRYGCHECLDEDDICRKCKIVKRHSL
eukprot:276573_1